MEKFLTIAAVMVVVALAIAAACLWWQYRLWPPQVWARRVKSRMAELRSRLDHLLHPRGDERSAAEKLAEELFEEQKQAVSVEALARYDGIGPKTVEWLQNAGLRTLTQAETHTSAVLFKKKIENLGPVREQALANAVRDLLHDEQQRFDQGRSQQGAQYRTRLAALSAQEQAQAAAKLREREAVERCLNAMRPLEELALEVSIVRMVTSRDVPGLSAEVMAKPLPEVQIAQAPPTAVIESTPEPAKAPLPGVAKLQAYCRFALLAAKADGRIAQSERGRIRVQLGDLFGSDPVLLRHLDPQLEQAEANLPTEADAIAAIKALTPKEEWRALYAFAEQIADAAGERVENEKLYLARLAAAFEIEAEAEVSPPPVVVPTSNAREVLGIPIKSELSVELIRRRYTILIAQICPEKAAQLGPEFAAMAEAKRAAAKAAALELLAPFDAPLDAPAAAPPQTNLRENSDLDDLFGSLSRG